MNHIDNENTATPQASLHTTTPSQLAQQINPESPTFIQDVLHKYRNLWKNGRIGKLKDFEVKLHVDPSVQPVIQPERRIPFHLRKKVDAELDKLEKQGIIEPVTGPTPWVSPIVVIPKPNSDDVRICVDMRSPNKCIKRERHPMPTADELISSLHGAKIFSEIDLNAGYHQLSLAEESRHLTTFSTHRGLRRYTRLNFGTNSAAEQFQQAVQQTLSGIPGVMNISDDIIVFGADKTAHNRALQQCFASLEENGLTINRKKCEFYKDKLDFYGLTFSGEGISPDDKKVEAFKNAPPPTNSSEVRSLLGMSNWFSKWIPDYATITAPLRALTVKHAKFMWKAEHREAWLQLKEALTSAPVIVYFDPNRKSKVIPDVSPAGLSAILAQEVPGTNDWKVIAYASRALTPTEQRYAQVEREALAIVYGVEHFHLYLYGAPDFELETDNKPLELIYRNPRSRPPARIERWLLRLADYNFTVKHLPGKENPSDYMSRHPRFPPTTLHSQIAEDYVNFLTHHAVPKAITLSEIEEETQKDHTMQAVRCFIQQGNWPNFITYHKPQVNKDELIIFHKVRQELTVCDKVILKRNLLVLPKSLRNRALNRAHQGHLGLSKTKALIREKTWFPYIDTLTEELITSCLPCQLVGLPKPPAPLQPTQLPPKPWHTVNMDFLGPLPSGEMLLVVIDQYSRFSEVEILRSTAASATIPKLDSIFARHGYPVKVRTDNGPPWNSTEIDNYMHRNRIQFKPCTPPFIRKAIQRLKFL